MNTPGRSVNMDETTEAKPVQEQEPRLSAAVGADPLQPADRKDAWGGDPQATGPRNAPETSGFTCTAAQTVEPQMPQPQAAAPVANLDGIDYWTKMATVTANIVAQALIQSNDLDNKPRHHVGPRPVEQKALPDGAPYSGDRKKFQLWWTLLLSVLGKAHKIWHAAMKRLHELPVTSIKA